MKRRQWEDTEVYSLVPPASKPLLQPWRVNVDLSRGLIIGRRQEDVRVVFASLSAKAVPACLIDLDAARGIGEQGKLVCALIERWPNYFWLGGGIKDAEHAVRLLALGVRGVVVGSALFSSGRVNRALLSEMQVAIKLERLIVSVDFADGMIVTNGFETSTRLQHDRALAEVAELLKPGAHVQLVDAAASVRRTSPPWQLIESIGVTYQHLNVWYAGNLRSWTDMAQVSALGVAPTVGRAYLTGPLGLTI